MSEFEKIEVEALEGAEVTAVKEAVQVETSKNEYVISGDEIYIAKKFDEAPGWLKDYVSTSIETGTSSSSAAFSAANQALLDAIVANEAAKNTYRESIISESDIDSQITARLSTLNTTVGEHSATIAELDTTYVRDDQVGATVTDIIDASLDNGSINARIEGVQSAQAGVNEAMAEDINKLDVQINGVGGASVLDVMQAYVGIDGSGASTNQGLSAYMEDENGVIGGATSDVANSVEVDADGNKKSKWEYNSNIVIDGVTYPSGFGLKVLNSDSEFFVNANKFKVTNSDDSLEVPMLEAFVDNGTPKIALGGDLIVDTVKPRTGDGFEIKADGTAGPNDDCNVYGSVIRGGSMYASSIESSTLQLTEAVFKSKAGLPTRGSLYRTARFSDTFQFLGGYCSDLFFYTVPYDYPTMGVEDYRFSVDKPNPINLIGDLSMAAPEYSDLNVVVASFSTTSSVTSIEFMYTYGIGNGTIESDTISVNLATLPNNTQNGLASIAGVGYFSLYRVGTTVRIYWSPWPTYDNLPTVSKSGGPLGEAYLHVLMKFDTEPVGYSTYPLIVLHSNV